MNKKHYSKWVFMICVVAGLGSCNLDMPVEKNSSFTTMTVEKQDITMPVKFSAKMKGRTDVLITPQVSGQLTRIAVSEGQQVKKGAVLFVIDPRNAQLDYDAAKANLEAALASESSAKLEYESTKRLFEKGIVSAMTSDVRAERRKKSVTSTTKRPPHATVCPTERIDLPIMSLVSNTRSIE